MKQIFKVISVLTLFFIGKVALAMKLALPEKFEFFSSDKKIQLIYKPRTDVVVKHSNGKWIWKSVQPKYPSKVVLSPNAKVAFFLGSYGDAGVGLGQVDIYDIETGNLLHQFDVTQVIPDLVTMSKSYGGKTNFPWISSTRLKVDGQHLVIKICDKIDIEIDIKEKKMALVPEIKWFNSFKCEQLQLQQFDSLNAKKPANEMKISDQEYIRSLQSEINQFPIEGDIMKEMSENSQLTILTFTCEGQKESVEFYDGRIKTPANSFYSADKNFGKNIFAELQQLVQKTKLKYDTPISYFNNHELQFEDFTLKYLGQKDETPAGTTATMWVQYFQLKSVKDSKESILKVYSGQLPPNPVEFQLSGKKLTLYTWEYKGKSLNSRRLVVGENNK